MAADVDIKSNFFWSRGRRVYSRSGALTIALNTALPLAAFGWLLVGMSQGGWKVNKQWIARWRWRSLAASAGLGLAVFLLLPKAEVETVGHAPVDEIVLRYAPLAFRMPACMLKPVWTGPAKGRTGQAIKNQQHKDNLWL